MNATDLMNKASTAVASAKLLLDANDIDGACNRAYYAMFDAAKAALVWADAPIDPTAVKTHSGLISAFSLHLVKPGKIAVDLGKAFNRVGEIRMIADYSGDHVTQDNAEWAIDQASEFVAAVASLDPES